MERVLDSGERIRPGVSVQPIRRWLLYTYLVWVRGRNCNTNTTALLATYISVKYRTENRDGELGRPQRHAQNGREASSGEPRVSDKLHIDSNIHIRRWSWCGLQTGRRRRGCGVAIIMRTAGREWHASAECTRHRYCSEAPGFMFKWKCSRTRAEPVKVAMCSCPSTQTRAREGGRVAAWARLEPTS